MEVFEFKSQLLERIEHQAEWRDGKAAEYPDDQRNENSARALRALYKQLEVLPENAPLLVRLAGLWEGADDSDAIAAFSETEAEVLRTYGFGRGDAGGEPDSFLTEMIDALAAELDHERTS